MQDYQVRHQVVVLDNFALLMPHVLGNDALSTEEQPLSEVVELFALVGGCVDVPAKFDIVDVIQQEHRTHHAAELAESEVQLVFPAVGPQSAQDHRGGDLAGFDRDGYSKHVWDVALNQRPVDGGSEQAIDM